MRGPKPRPSRSGPHGPAGLPRCPAHLDNVARNEWRRLATPMFEAGVLTLADRAAFAAYCQAYARWVEAENRLRETPMLLKTPSGYVQQSPWLSVANKQLELMGRFMAELGLTPVSRTRLPDPGKLPVRHAMPTEIVLVSAEWADTEKRSRIGAQDQASETADQGGALSFDPSGSATSSP